MISVLVMAGFFLAIAAALQFSSWAERWLTASKPQQGQATKLAIVGSRLLPNTSERNAVRAPSILISPGAPMRRSVSRSGGSS